MDQGGCEGGETSRKEARGDCKGAIENNFVFLNKGVTAPPVCRAEKLDQGGEGMSLGRGLGLALEGGRPGPVTVLRAEWTF